MESIIKKAIEGGYKSEHRQDFENLEECCKDCSAYKTFEQYMFSALKNNKNILFIMVLDPLFWKALGKSCGWGEVNQNGFGTSDALRKIKKEDYKYHTLRFHEINLTEGWNTAVKYLEDLIK